MYASIPRTVLLTAVLLALAACAPQDVALPTSPPEARVSEWNRDHVGAATASIEERIWLSDVVVRANLQSAAAGLLTFRAVEYVKGTGFSMFTVSAETDGRPTTWDGQEAVLFLGASATRPTTAFVFTDTTTWRYTPERPEDSYAGTLPAGYTVDSRNPVWVPLSSESGSARAYAVGGGESLDLDDLRATIAWLGGSGPGYDGCIRASLFEIRSYRDWEVYYGGPLRLEYDATIPSGDAAAIVHQSRRTAPHPPYTAYPKRWIDGQDRDLFSAATVDDDTDPANGFAEALRVTRPLPAGSYGFRYRAELRHDVPCNYITEEGGSFWDVTVTAPAGTLHEAFFDPVAIGTALGADAANGVVEPAGFTVGGVSTTLQSLKWQSGTVTLELSSAASLSGYDMDVIELDGSVSLTLSVAGATSNAGGALTWAVATQPWHADDQLMLRLRTA